MITELKQLNDTFYKIFDDLKKAGQSLAGNDEAIKCIREKILEQYELEYKLLDLKCRVATEREIDKLEARYVRLVPQRWEQRILRVFKRHKQNYAATLIDLEANQKAAEFFSECEKELAEREAKRLAAAQAQAELDDEFEIVDDAAEILQDEPQEESENAPVGESTAAQEKSQPSSEDAARSAESDPHNVDPNAKFPKVKKKEKKGGGKNVREGDQT